MEEIIYCLLCFAIVCYAIHKDFFIKDIISEIKEIANEEKS